ncbi:MAG: amidohydrolase family protein [Planctomycetota bacterium]
MRNRQHLVVWILAAGMLCVTAVAGTSLSGEDQPAGKEFLLIRAEWTFDGLGSEVEKGICILCEGDRIKAIGPEIKAPAGARILEGEGLCVMPGLIDAHVRLLDGFLVSPVYLFPAFGVTTVCDFENSVLCAEGLNDTIASGQITGPGLVYSGESLTKSVKPMMFQIPVVSPEETRTAVRKLADHGAGLLVLSSGLEPAAARVAIEEAAARGMKIAADLLESREIDASSALEMNIDRLERMGGIPQAIRVDRENTTPLDRSALFDWLEQDPEKQKTLIKEIVRKGVFLVPSLVAFEKMSLYPNQVLSEENLDPSITQGTLDYWTQVWDGFAATPWWPAACRLHFEYSRRFIKEAVEAGAMIAAGSATPTPGVLPGLGLHRELELLVQAGLSEPQAIKAATAWAAQCIGKESLIGTLESGKRADLLIVEGNPLDDIRKTRNIRWVILGGKIVKREEIPGLNPIKK